MRDRPIYIGFLCLYLVFANAWFLVHSFKLIDSPAMQHKMQLVPLPIPAQETQYFVGLIVPLFTAMFMWEGANWARVVYLAWGIGNYLLEAIILPDKHDLQPGVCIFALTAIILLLPGPRGYFLLPQHHS